MSPVAIVSLVLTVIAWWIAQDPPEAIRAFGVAGSIAWIACVALGWAFAMLALLTKSAITSIDQSLRPDVAMTPVGDDRVPAALRAVADQLTALGLTRATPPLSITLSNPAVFFGFVHDGGDVAASAFAIQPPGPRPPVTSFDFVSWLEGDRGGLTTSPNPAGSALRATPGALRQVFPGGDPATLLKRHREALDWLRTQGARAKTLRATEFEPLFRASMGRQRGAFERAKLRFALTAIWRTVRKSTPHLGPVQTQPSTPAQIDFLLGRGRPG
jgi:hypothetical protein